MNTLQTTTLYQTEDCQLNLHFIQVNDPPVRETETLVFVPYMDLVLTATCFVNFRTQLLFCLHKGFLYDNQKLKKLYSIIC